MSGRSPPRQRRDKLDEPARSALRAIAGCIGFAGSQRRVSTGDDPGTSTLVLSGPSTLYESSELRETLLAALVEGKTLRIDLETSGPWDIAGLQLLVSVVISGRKAGQAVRLVNVPRVCVEIASRSGLSEWLNEAADSFL